MYDTIQEQNVKKITHQRSVFSFLRLNVFLLIKQLYIWYLQKEFVQDHIPEPTDEEVGKWAKKVLSEP